MLDVQTLFSLNDQQAAAAWTLDQNVIVTAGAGSGKTRTLVARYLLLLDAGHSPRHLVAITFTRKAAREMRNRVRSELLKLRSQAQEPEQQNRWASRERQMDSARIGTIHSLCEEILRSHPAQAALDPEFEVLDEGRTAALRMQTIEETLNQAVQNAEFRPLFNAFEVRMLENSLRFALDHRLELAGWLEDPQKSSPNRVVLAHLEGAFCRHEQVQMILDDLRLMRESGDLVADAGDKLADQVNFLLDQWETIEDALDGGDLAAAMVALHSVRKEGMKLNVGRRNSECKERLRELRNLYAGAIEGWLNDPDPQVEAAWNELLPVLAELFSNALELYGNHLAQLRALDFDDLEAGAVRLLENPTVRRHWQSEIEALLVDEFQDTNRRQRAIVEALSGGQPGRLFLVGDERQSIYRFRGADVTVFHAMQEDIKSRGGAVQRIDTTFRAHHSLLEAVGDLLEPAMQTDREPTPPYWVSFSPLEAHRKKNEDHIQSPHIEFVIGSGEDSGEARRTAANGLAGRLLALKGAGQIQSWDEVGLLFRASTHFGVYEDALEKAGIPYVTIAGRGFYDRPEIRDLLNILKAVSDPWDDLAVAGLLRSPAFGLTDETLFRLRWPNGRNGQPAALQYSISGDLSALHPEERVRAQRAARFLAKMAPQVDRLPVAVLLKQVMDTCNLRAILGGGPLGEAPSGKGSRLWRNLDKLLADAHASGMVRVRAFLEYLQTLRDVDVREGEAAADVEGALQLMTVHKSKGLEFPVVVLADAGYKPPSFPQPAYLLPEIGLAVNPDKFEAKPAAYRLSKWLDDHQSKAEEKRLLYVALTRAREKVIISGHISTRVYGWLDDLAAAADLDLKAATSHPGRRQIEELHGGQTYSWQVLTEQLLADRTSPLDATSDEAKPPPYLGEGVAIYGVTELQSIQEPDEENGFVEREDWRATGGQRAPSRVVGDLFHKALQRWRLPPDPDLRDFLESAALHAGLADPTRRLDAVRRAEILLDRFAAHPLRSEIEASLDRRHRLPYTQPGVQGAESGFIDLLYRTTSGWRLLDFRTDELKDQAALDEALERHRKQAQQYIRSVAELLGQAPETLVCLLDADGEVLVVP